MTSYGTADTQIQQTTDKKTLLNNIQTHLDKLITDMNIIKTRVDQTHRSSVNKITLIRGMVSDVLEQIHLDKLITDMNIIKTQVVQTHRSSVNKITLIRGMVSEVLEEIEMEQRNMPMGTALSQEQMEAIEAVEAQEAQEELDSLLSEIGDAMSKAPGRGGIGIHRSRRRRRTTKRRR